MAVRPIAPHIAASCIRESPIGFRVTISSGADGFRTSAFRLAH